MRLVFSFWVLVFQPRFKFSFPGVDIRTKKVRSNVEVTSKLVLRFWEILGRINEGGVMCGQSSIIFCRTLVVCTLFGSTVLGINLSRLSRVVRAACGELVMMWSVHREATELESSRTR